MSEPETSGSEIKYGTFANRMLASTIDICIIFMVALPLVDMVLAQFIPGVNVEHLVEVITSLHTKYKNLPAVAMLISIWQDPEFWKVAREQHLILHAAIENVLQVACIALYILPFWFRHSTTPGKMLFRLEIRDAKTGDLMSDRQAVLRFFGYFVSGITFSLGFVWISFNRKCRGFHDIIAGTVVVVKQKKPAVSSVRRSEGP